MMICRSAFLCDDRVVIAPILKSETFALHLQR